MQTGRSPHEPAKPALGPGCYIRGPTGTVCVSHQHPGSPAAESSPTPFSCWAWRGHTAPPVPRRQSSLGVSKNPDPPCSIPKKSVLLNAHER